MSLLQNGNRKCAFCVPLGCYCALDLNHLFGSVSDRLMTILEIGGSRSRTQRTQSQPPELCSAFDAILMKLAASPPPTSPAVCEKSSNEGQKVDYSSRGSSCWRLELVDEEANGLDFDIYSQANRQDGENFAELKIVLPVQVPSGVISVNALTGEAFYGIHGAQVDREVPHSVQVLFGRGTTNLKKPSTGGTKASATWTHEFVDPTYSESDLVACDTWASFLRLEIGTIFNIRHHQVQMVASQFRKAMNKFHSTLGTLRFTAKGVKAVDIASGRVIDEPSLFSSLNPGSRIQYVTSLSPVNKRTIEGLVGLRQHLKVFAANLGCHFGEIPIQSGDKVVKIGVALDSNLKSHRIMSGDIRLPIRTFDPTLARSLRQLIWTFNPHTGTYCNHTSDRFASPLEATEMRLEFTEGYQVDPRWPSHLLLTRPIVKSDDGLHSDARIIFVANPTAVSVLYTIGFQSRESAKVMLKRYKTGKKSHNPNVVAYHMRLSAKVTRRLLQKTELKEIYRSHLRFQPNAGATGTSDTSPMTVRYAGQQQAQPRFVSLTSLNPMAEEFVPSPKVFANPAEKSSVKGIRNRRRGKKKNVTETSIADASAADSDTVYVDITAGTNAIAANAAVVSPLIPCNSVLAIGETDVA